VEVFNYLIKIQKVRSARQFAHDLDIMPQSLNEILKGRREVPHSCLETLVQKFNVRSEFILTGKGPILIEVLALKELKILNIITDMEGKEWIIHVPITAHAGYAISHQEPEFVCELPKYSIPGMTDFRDGSMRSFDVAGESMMPCIYPGDRVVGVYVHHVLWEQKLKENTIYVIITKNEIVVKRLSNLIRTEQKILLHSDNPEFLSYAINIQDICEIWEVKLKLSTQLEVIKPLDNNQDLNLMKLNQAIEKQTKLLEKMVNKLDSN
ncbi:MAG: hypothetical protein M3Q56_10750, partial [Bacteroidota bacterium]|nr:hypothetical protein [Bacteroidota bacterium]